MTGARGSVLDVAAGTGANLVHYPSTVDRVVRVDPDARMLARAAARLPIPGSRSMPPLVVQQLMMVEREFLELGPSAEAFRRAAAAAGTSKLAGELADIVDPERSLGREAPVAALARTLEFQRFRAQEFRSTVAANGVAPTPTPAGRRLELMLARIRESRPRSARPPRSPSSSVGL